MSRSIKSRAADDHGVVLVAVMGAIMLISVLATGGYFLASQALHESVKHTDASRAFQVASSGMDRELASFSTTNFDSGSTGYVKSGSTPDGSYQLTVSQDGGVSFMYTMRSVGSAAGEVSTVETTFFYMDLWAMSIGSGTNPDGNDFGSGASWNGNSTIYGPLYVKGNVDLNSNPDLYYGPLFVSEGNVNFKGAVKFHPYTNQKYKIFASGTVQGEDPAKCEIYNSCPSITLPWLDEAYFSGMRQKAREQSSDNMLGTTDQANQEVATAGSPSTYTGTRAPGATQYYKEINGPLTITGTTPSFGKLDAAGQTRDDFAWDNATKRLHVNGVVFVDGDVTIGGGVKEYQGNGIIVATGDVRIDTGNSFQPWNDNGDGKANDLSIENCLGVAAGGDIYVHGCTFEGVVFTNNALILSKSGGTYGEFEGIVHANNIISDTPQNILEMEIDFSPALLPEGMPGSSSDPRGPEYSSQGMLVPGTWIRR